MQLLQPNAIISNSISQYASQFIGSPFVDISIHSHSRSHCMNISFTPVPPFVYSSCVFSNIHFLCLCDIGAVLFFINAEISIMNEDHHMGNALVKSQFRKLQNNYNVKQTQIREQKETFFLFSQTDGMLPFRGSA